MAEKNTTTARPLPTWIKIVGSILVLLHIGVFVVHALNVSSGPWPSPMGPSPSMPPQFATSLDQVPYQFYLEPLSMTHNYRFVANRTEKQGVYFEVKLKGASGDIFKTLKFPDDNANFWVRHRQDQLAQALGNDEPVMPRAGEVVPAPNQKVQTVTIWEPGENDVLKLRTISELLIPRDRPVFRPTEWSQLMAKCYMRYLCREHGAKSAELIRISREPVYPIVLYSGDVQPQMFNELKSHFGEYHSDK